MNKSDVLKLADDAGIVPWVKLEVVNGGVMETEEGMDGDMACLLQFAQLIVEAERKRIERLAQAEIDRVAPLYAPTAENILRAIRECK